MVRVWGGTLRSPVLEPWDAPLPYADYTTGLLVGSRRSGREGSVNVGEGAGTGVPSGM